MVFARPGEMPLEKLCELVMRLAAATAGHFFAGASLFAKLFDERSGGSGALEKLSRWRHMASAESREGLSSTFAPAVAVSASASDAPTSPGVAARAGAAVAGDAVAGAGDGDVTTRSSEIRGMTDSTRGFADLRSGGGADTDAASVTGPDVAGSGVTVMAASGRFAFFRRSGVDGGAGKFGRRHGGETGEGAPSTASCSPVDVGVSAGSRSAGPRSSGNGATVRFRRAWTKTNSP